MKLLHDGIELGVRLSTNRYLLALRSSFVCRSGVGGSEVAQKVRYTSLKFLSILKLITIRFYRKSAMKVYLKADIKGVGMAGEIITVSDGYARNYLFPRNHAVEITPDNEKQYINRIKTFEHRKEVIATQTSMMAERIGSAQVTLRRKMHHDGKLYGSVGSADIADALKEQGFTVAKSQVVIDKSIKEKGAHTVIIKLTSRLQPKLKVVIAPE